MLLNSDLKNGDKIAELIVKDALKTNSRGSKSDSLPKESFQEYSAEKEITEISADNLFNQFLKDGNYMILGGVNEEELPFTIEIKDKKGNTIYSIESEDILDHIEGETDSDDEETGTDTDE